MHTCKTYMYINFQPNWVSRSISPTRAHKYPITAKINYFYRQQTDRQTDGRTKVGYTNVGLHDNNRYFFEKKLLKIDFSSKCKSAMTVTYTQMQRCDHLYTDSVNLM